MHSCIRLRITRVVIKVKVSPVNRLGPCCHEVDLAGGRCDSTPGLVCVVPGLLPGVRGVSGGPARGERSPGAVAPLSLSQKYALLLARTCYLLQPSHSTHKPMNVGRSQAVLRRTATTSGEFWTQAVWTHWRRQLPGTGCICPSPGFPKKQLIVTLFWSHTKYDGDLLFQITSGFCIYSTVVKISSFFIFSIQTKRVPVFM